MFWGFCSSWGAFCFAVLVVLPLVLCFFSSWCCGWQWFFNADHCYWRLSFDAPGLLGCLAVFPSFGGFLLVLWGFCFLFSKCPLQLLLMGCVVFCASGLLLLPLLLLLLLFFSFFFLFFLFLAFFFFGCLCSLWSPSCFPCLWPSLVLGLAGPSWPLFVVVLVLSSIVWGWWWWWPRWRWLRRGCWWWSAFALLWCVASVCSLAWWWLVFVRLWFWCGWLVVAFARLWWPRVCSLGRWLASVCLGSVVAAGFVVACHGYAAWDAVPRPLRLGELFGTYTLLVLFCGSVDVFLWRNSRVSRSSLKCMHGYSGSCWCWRPRWCYMLLKWRVCYHCFGLLACSRL